MQKNIGSAIKKYRIMFITFSVQLFLMALFHVSFVAVIQEWLNLHGHEQSIFFWTLLFLCSIPLLSVGFMSSTFLAIVAGYFLSWNSLWYYIIAYIASAYLGYHLIVYIDKGKTLLALNNSKRLDKIKNFLIRYPFSSVVLLRFSPVISFGQLTALCAFFKIKTSTYITASTVGMLPRTLLAVWSGMTIKSHYANLEHYSLPKEYTPIIIVLFMISFLGILYTFKRSLSNKKILY